MDSSHTKAYTELKEKDKRAILGALLSRVDNGILPRGSCAFVARKLGFPARRVSRLWSSAKSTRANLVIATPEVSSKKLGNNKEIKKIYDRELLQEETLAIPHWKRQTVRNLAHELKMPRSTLHDILKKEGKEVMSQKTSRLKVNLNEEQMLQRIMYCLSMTRWRRTRSSSLTRSFKELSIDILIIKNGQSLVHYPFAQSGSI